MLLAKVQHYSSSSLTKHWQLTNCEGGNHWWDDDGEGHTTSDGQITTMSRHTDILGMHLEIENEIMKTRFELFFQITKTQTYSFYFLFPKQQFCVYKNWYLVGNTCISVILFFKRKNFLERAMYIKSNRLSKEITATITTIL